MVAVPRDLRGWIASWYQTPIARVTVANATVLRVTDVEVSLGYDQQSAEAQVTAVSPAIPTWTPGQPVTVQLGFAGSGGALQPVFGGEIEEVDLAYFPHEVSFRAAGYLRRLQFRYGDDLTWSNVDDGALWAELLRLSGVPAYQTDAGEGIVYGTREPVRLRAGETPRDLIDKLDQSSPTGMRTYEIAGRVYRSPVLGVPAARVGTSYAQGDPASGTGPSGTVLHLVEVSRTDTVADVANRVRVEGLPDKNEVNQVYADRRADSPYVPVDADGRMRDVQYDFSSDLLETREQCDALAQRYLVERNRRTDQLRMRAPLNPLLVPGRTLGLTASKLGLPSERPYWIRHVRHSWGADGAFTEVDLEGGAGETGYLIGLDPVAAFTATATREAFLVGGETQGVVTVHFDGSPSYDPDGQVVLRQWSTSTGKLGTGKYWACDFSDAEWSPAEGGASIEVTLTVTDDDDDPTGPHTDTVTQGIDAEVTPLAIRTVYVAARSVAEATPDGGETWTTWTPPAGVVVATPQIAPLDHSYFGLSTGALHRTSDALLSEPELVHTFPSGVACVWVNEVNSERVWVGCEDGSVWLTGEASLGAEAGWVRKADLARRVNWLVESYANDDEVRACAGADVLITFDGFGTSGPVATLAGGTARSVALGFFGNYAAGEAAAPVVAEGSSAAVAFPGASPQPGDVRVTAFADRDGVMALDELGRAFVKGPGETAFTAVAPTGAGAVGGVVRDGEQPSVFYAASAGGLVKTFDAGSSWRPLRSYGGASAGLQVGYGAAPMGPIAPGIRRVIRGSQDPTIATHFSYIPDNGTIVACTLWNEATKPVPDTPPANWMQPAYDEATWTGAGGRPHAWATPQWTQIGGANMLLWRIWDCWNDDNLFPGARQDAVYRSHEQSLFRHRFTLPPGPYLRAFVDTVNLQDEDPPDAGYSLVWRDAIELYVNGHAVGPGHARAWIDPTWLFDDGVTENVIAVRASSHLSLVAGRRCAWKLTVSTDPAGLQLESAPDGGLVWTGGDDARITPYVDPADGGTGVAPDWGAPARPEEANGPPGTQEMSVGLPPPWIGGGGHELGAPSIEAGAGFEDAAGLDFAQACAYPFKGDNPHGYVAEVYRFVARLPADLVVTRARMTLKWYSPALLGGVNLNGVPIEGVDRADNPTSYTVRDYEDLDPALLRPGALNCLAVLVRAPETSIVSFYLEMH